MLYSTDMHLSCTQYTILYFLWIVQEYGNSKLYILFIAVFALKKLSEKPKKKTFDYWQNMQKNS